MSQQQDPFEAVFLVGTLDDDLLGTHFAVAAGKLTREIFGAQAAGVSVEDVRKMIHNVALLHEELHLLLMELDEALDNKLKEEDLAHKAAG